MVTGIKTAISTMFINKPIKISHINGGLFFGEGSFGLWHAIC